MPLATGPLRPLATNARPFKLGVYRFAAIAARGDRQLQRSRAGRSVSIATSPRKAAKSSSGKIGRDLSRAAKASADLDSSDLGRRAADVERGLDEFTRRNEAEARRNL